MRRAALVLSLIALPLAPLLATGAAAQERAPVERAYLTELAYVLGESHALRQACVGSEDQFWRQRMQRLTEVEQADQGFDAQLRDRFNTGYAAGQAQHPGCDRETRRAAGVAAQRGKALAIQLASVVLPSASPSSERPE